MERDAADIRAIATPLVGETGGLITALRAIQASNRCVPQAADAILADVFNLSRAEVRGVVSFYSDFSREPKARTVVRVCAAEACQAAGGRTLAAAVEQSCALKMGEADTAGNLCVEPVYCLGLCSAAPAAMVNDKLVGLASESKIEKAIEDASAERAL